MEYNFKAIDAKWQEYWVKNRTYRVTEDAGKPKYYVLDMFPYPSGAGLHVGHPLGYIASDIFSRFKRHQGFNVLHPMGYDAYGLPAEQYAIQTGQHPSITTEQNIRRYREQLDKIGLSFDWEREVWTCDPGYYKWTQWAFIRMFHSYYCYDRQQARPIDKLIQTFEQSGAEGLNVACGCELSFTADEWKAKSEKEQQEILLNYRLAYLGDTMVNWCAALGTVLANDEVSEGLSIRGGHLVEQKLMRQWCLRVSAYAQRLLDGLDTISWTDSLKETQRNWIGRSEGAEIWFNLSPGPSPQERGVSAPEAACQNRQYFNETFQNPTSDTKREESHLDNNLSKRTTPLSCGEGPGERFMETSCQNRRRFDTTDWKHWKKLERAAKNMRSHQTEAENVLWQKLRAAGTGHKIRRQHIVDTFIVDFVSLDKGVVIEIDGGIHNSAEQKEYDEIRTQILEDNGFEVIRFSNDEVLQNLSSVVQKIKVCLDNKPSKKWDDLDTITRERTPLSCGEGSGERSESGLLVFTTRADTIYGVTFMVLAPESEYVDMLVQPEQKAEADAYLQTVKRRTERERIADRSITGVFTGSYAVNPFNGEEIPVWISDYVLAGYGTGAIMAVPAHDSRDYAFAKHFNLPIVPLIEGCDVSEESFDAKEGVMINSGILNGLTVPEAIQRAKDYIRENNIGRVKVNYRLRDAIFSRQRYWGEPFPICYRDGMPYTVDEADLPVRLPDVDKFLPTETGEPPLGRAENWTYRGYPLELCTMPGFAGSSAYYLRYEDPQNDAALVSPEANGYWRNVDLYIGGTEHATGHLIYSRFWNKFLYDLGIIHDDEPFKKLINQGMIQGRSNFVYRIKGTNQFVSYNLKDQYDVTEIHVDVNIVHHDVLDTEAFKKWSPDYASAEFILEEDGRYLCGWAVEKMSKSMYNVVNPDMIIEQYGADTLRMYEMFLGPLEQSKPWDTAGIEGVHRFLRKVWNLFYAPLSGGEGSGVRLSDEAPTPQELKSLHKTIKKVTSDIENFSFNTAVSAFMICANELQEQKCNKRQILEPFVILLAPFAPHLAEELWQTLGHTESVTGAPYPVANEQYLVESSFTYPVSFNGKTRFTIELPADMDAKTIEETILATETARKWTEGKTPKKVIIVPKKIVNVVI